MITLNQAIAVEQLMAGYLKIVIHSLDAGSTGFDAW
jgi:hypothetical protein